MFKRSLKQQLLPIILLAIVLAIVFSGDFLKALNGKAFSSVEVRLAEQSPLGSAGGAIVPASCPSYSHMATYCNAEEGDVCFNIPGWQDVPPDGYTLYETPGVYRLCCHGGFVPSGPYTCVPACASNAGQACVSSPNFCGQTNSGIAACNGSCPATPPSNSNCPPSQQPPTITVNPPTVGTGGTTTITWNCPGNTSATGTNFSTGGAASGNTTVTVNTTTTYTLNCPQTGTQVTTQVTVSGPALSLSASPTRVRVNDSSTLTWAASSVTSCALTGPGVNVHMNANGSGIISTQNTSTGGVVGQSVYKLTCQTGSGTISSSVTVNLIPSQVEQ